MMRDPGGRSPPQSTCVSSNRIIVATDRAAPRARSATAPAAPAVNTTHQAAPGLRITNRMFRTSPPAGRTWNPGWRSPPIFSIARWDR